MSPEELNNWLRGVAEEVSATRSNYPINVVRGCPIPFFGNILTARVLTVGVNPSNTEFRKERLWREPLNHLNWQARLLNYFNFPDVPAHPFFETWSICLRSLGLTYCEREAAHIDVSPRPTIPMLSDGVDKLEFRKMAEHDVKWFFELLSRLPQVQLLLVAGPIPAANGTKQQLAEFIARQAGMHGANWIEDRPLPRLITLGHPEGIPIFVCPFEPNVNGCFAMIRQVDRNREILRPFAAQRNGSIPILPTHMDWPSLIGNFMLNFGTLDHLVFAFLKDRIPPEEFEQVKKWHFKDRLSRIAKYLKDADCPQDDQEAFTEWLMCLEPVREVRNHLAHGHMYMRTDVKNQRPVVTVLKAKDLDTGLLPNSKHIQFSELLSALTSLTSLIEGFLRLRDSLAQNPSELRASLRPLD